MIVHKGINYPPALSQKSKMLEIKNSIRCVPLTSVQSNKVLFRLDVAFDECIVREKLLLVTLKITSCMTPQ